MVFISQAMPSSALGVLPGCGHYLVEEAAEAIVPMIHEYLRARYLHAPHGHDDTSGLVMLQLERRPPWVELEEDERFDQALRRGRIVFTLHGKKLRGGWTLVRTSGRKWLLIKRRDRWASTVDIARAKPRSVQSRRLLAGIARDNGGNIAKAATGDPA